MNSRERFTLMLGKIASQIESHRLESFKFLCKDSIPEGDMERISSPEALFIELEHRMKLGPNQVEFVCQCLEQVGRKDLASKLMAFDEKRGGKKIKEILIYFILLYVIKNTYKRDHKRDHLNSKG